MDIAGKRILITGGSSGIGLEMARRMLQAGGRLVITGRRTAALGEALAMLAEAGEVTGLAADVATSEGRAETIAASLKALGGLDILVNNAGIVRGGRLEDVGEDEIRAMIEVDLTAPILLTRAALPALRASGAGLVVNISSGIGQVALPFYTTYAAVKAGIAHFGEALRRELAGEGISVLNAFPTATATPMMASANVPSAGLESVEEVAAEIVQAIIEDRREVVRGGPERLALVARNRTEPDAVDAEMRERKAAIAERARAHIAL
ncbi:SDR family NAD(P)-dependent oxidoreductase [Sphingomonas quercus]|uniref:SDR family NAD(P)-dependent oxidoreductase n=1 Tax=Sphingomonas quercus TaxID=2842451 RepID=A0ABS6BJQ4_9SPHN|nr:SDR family NAD(P)-dependent oxidoreductase [Sphingomonas quercus]MBU3077857.1 SDR family NAD(P)-dependent oxidoreductase [Sphingomonas quercus]